MEERIAGPNWGALAKPGEVEALLGRIRSWGESIGVLLYGAQLRQEATR